MPCNAPELFKGFSKLDKSTRFERLVAMGALDQSAADFLTQGGLQNLSLAEHFIENAIGYFQLPLGVASYFRIDNKDYAIPMAVEETSIIAALSKSAKWIRDHGEISTSIEGDCSLGQIQIAKVQNPQKLAALIEQQGDLLIESANENVASGLVRRGGGVKKIQLRLLERPDGATMGVIHLHVNCVDAMGANIINQILEYLKPAIENLSNEEVTMCILSNLNDTKLITAKVSINDVDAKLGQRIEEASFFAELDPYRAATHNKGVLNGIDPIVVATGNDWRAVEAGIHAYAAQCGHYQAITKWRYNDGQLIGHFKAPIAVGIVGGVTTLHPAAQLSLSMLGVSSADELARVIAAVGLVQNLGALKALTTDGIIKGHMKLHIDNLILSTDANETEVPSLKNKLENWLEKHKRVSLSTAIELLDSIRQKASL